MPLLLLSSINHCANWNISRAALTDGQFQQALVHLAMPACQEADSKLFLFMCASFFPPWAPTQTHRKNRKLSSSSAWNCIRESFNQVWWRIASSISHLPCFVPKRVIALLLLQLWTLLSTLCVDDVGHVFAAAAVDVIMFFPFYLAVTFSSFFSVIDHFFHSTNHHHLHHCRPCIVSFPFYPTMFSLSLSLSLSLSFSLRSSFIFYSFIFSTHSTLNYGQLSPPPTILTIFASSNHQVIIIFSPLSQQHTESTLEEANLPSLFSLIILSVSFSLFLSSKHNNNAKQCRISSTSRHQEQQHQQQPLQLWVKTKRNKRKRKNSLGKLDMATGHYRSIPIASGKLTHSLGHKLLIRSKHSKGENLI